MNAIKTHLFEQTTNFSLFVHQNYQFKLDLNCDLILYVNNFEFLGFTLTFHYKNSREDNGEVFLPTFSIKFDL